MDVENRMDIEPPSPQNKPPSLSARAQALLQASRVETGFDSYLAYLDFHAKEDPRMFKLSRLLTNYTRHVRQDRTDAETNWAGSILSVLETDISLEHSDKVGTQIIETLCHPPQEARLQIVFWNHSQWADLEWQAGLLNFLGMYFRLDPVFFETLLDKAASFRPPFLSDLAMINRHNPTLIEAGPVVATVCRHKDQNNGVTVILIAGPLERRPDKPFPEFEFCDYICPCLPLSASPGPEHQSDIPQCPGPYRYYPRVLRWWLDRHPDAKCDDTSLLILCFLPLLQLNHTVLRLYSQELYTAYRSKTEEMYQLRADLRHYINVTENSWYGFMRYVKFRFKCDPTKQPIYEGIMDDYTDATSVATRLESEVRDYLSLQAGTLGLEESRKSIELSDRQMEEAKRGKLLHMERNLKRTC
ncbi:MAG: hypothetical protein Q9223_007190 [Gallowayella weberi]